jgi:sialidase-1
MTLIKSFSSPSATAALLTLFVGCAGILAQKSPPLFEESDVFVAGHGGINTYRIPSLISTKNGTLLAFSEGRRFNPKDGTPTDIVLKRSLAGAANWASGTFPKRGSLHPRSKSDLTWLPMQTLIRSVRGEAYMNPVPLIDSSSGTIDLLVNYYPPPYADVPAAIWLLTSKDDGATWTGPVDITSSVGKHELGPGDGIQLQSGRLMAPVYDGDIFSDDHGRTWSSSSAASGSMSETQVVELIDGTVILNRRGRPNRLTMKSEDDGRTWSEPVPHPSLPDPDCQGSLIRYTREDQGYTKNRLLFSNPVAGLDPASIQPSDPRGRMNVTVRLSYDEGKTWPISKRIKRGPSAYSSMTILPSGAIGILYEAGSMRDRFNPYRKLVLARFNLEWLTDGRDHLERGIGSK